jgi:hypothetical protein
MNGNGRTLCQLTGHGIKWYVFLHHSAIHILVHCWIQDEISKDPDTVGETFIPVILGSDKTTISVGTGNNEYYPLYLSIGNVLNNVRHAHRDTIAVIGFLAMPKSNVHLILCDLQVLIIGFFHIYSYTSER